MSSVGTRELRNNTADLLKRVKAGERVTVTVRGVPVAALVPIEQRRRRWLPTEELLRRLETARADPGLRDDLARLAGETTDDLEPPR
jgi:prevent-host-death family protein